ncbi:MAG: hypothetical protein GTO45_37665 [Candidatus Aminicenantes bacterium]|nr:hypothetical protein [Candidatus Aminicenantes bacterium]NIM84394.1 hypothetical protein [Candidatus Aminicenantes bacterium]NIN23881.1 hypothetical protein [Candidatus Aminicenantes bacterium]NIN47597.1 hypothetical protein [Candidatus Aminicenantes bacterium]NIN90517.1 hypothetical protein [Candidatus Aminicenantes bacterium]
MLNFIIFSLGCFISACRGIIRKLAYDKNRSYLTYRTYIEESSAQVAANTLICLIHQANYLLDQLLRQLEKQFLQKSVFTERLYHARQNTRRNS